jgi:hypothetical protein
MRGNTAALLRVVAVVGNRMLFEAIVFTKVDGF